jgi:hypothetical protein
VRKLAVLAAIVVVAGCSGDDGGGTTRGEWAAEANQVCRAYGRRIAALGTPTTPAGAEGFIRRAIPIAREEVVKLRELDAPEADAAKIDRMLDQVEQGIGALQGVLSARAGGDQAAVDEATQRGRRASDASNRIARELGASECAATPSSS